MAKQSEKAKSYLVDRQDRARKLWYKYQSLKRDNPTSTDITLIADIDPGFRYLEYLDWEPSNDAEAGASNDASEWLRSWDNPGGLTSWLKINLKKWREQWLKKEAEQATDKNLGSDYGKADGDKNDNENNDDENDDNENDDNENDDNENEDNDGDDENGDGNKSDGDSGNDKNYGDKANDHSKQNQEQPVPSGSPPKVSPVPVSRRPTRDAPLREFMDNNQNQRLRSGVDATNAGAETSIQRQPSSSPPQQAQYSRFYHWYRTVHRPAKKATSGGNGEPSTRRGA
ncbi:hypothetical protein CSUB01_10889 [Colletotrichum sublineola]|uniref:Uncharacterized protein n=1 Tax=Colletotrichum sublineola TaxID=1173701 RepID=A0A066XXY2_COLSU|nr:hypothetical protein CSUB01_10889 [Colletotrichum sublineola]